MEAFRYRSASTYYDAGKVGTDGTNWWKTTDQIRNYSSLAIGGILALTSLASAFGGQTLLNAQAWGILGLVGGLVGLAPVLLPPRRRRPKRAKKVKKARRTPRVKRAKKVKKARRMPRKRLKSETD